jgi:hypothetical protein
VNLRDLERLLVFLMNVSESDLDQRARRLRAARMLPQGGHGVNAPQISAEHAATMLIGVAAAARPGQVCEAVLKYAPMRAECPDEWGFAGKQTFGEALTHILDTPGLWPGKSSGNKTRVDRVEICCDAPEATVFYDNHEGEEVPYRYAVDPDDRYPIRRNVTIRAAALAQIALDLKEEIESGWDDDSWFDGSESPTQSENEKSS